MRSSVAPIEMLKCSFRVLSELCAHRPIVRGQMFVAHSHKGIDVARRATDNWQQTH